MKTVNVATLKEKLSEYLGRVENGEELVITSHRRPVAELVPESTSTLRIRPPLRPVRDLRKVIGVSPQQGFSADKELAWDRRR